MLTPEEIRSRTELGNIGNPVGNSGEKWEKVGNNKKFKLESD